MASENQQLHFILVPLMSSSHIIPLTDFAKLLARQGQDVTIITTPLNAIRLNPIIQRAIKSNLKVQLIPLRFPCQEAGLPEGCENLDELTSPDLTKHFFVASGMLQEPLEKVLAKLVPRPTCIVSTNAIPWTHEIAQKFGIPMYVFHTISCFTLVCSHSINHSKILETVNSDYESVLLPDMPHKIEFKNSQLPDMMRKNSSESKNMLDKVKEAENSAQGVVVNSFEELEPSYVEKCKNMMKNVWCIGPVSQCNKEMLDKFERGNKASIDENDCLKWLDSVKPKSVIYACFGSVSHISPTQSIEIGLGLEASNRPFIWIISDRDYSIEVKKWLEDDTFEERIKGRGLIIRGWAPQVLILSHSSIGGFLTHCGWNSTLEAVCAGVPMITWPMFAEQFYNEKFVVHVLRIGVRIGVEGVLESGEDAHDRVLVKGEQVKKAIDQLMDEGEEGEERRKRAREVGDMAKGTTEAGGSSYSNTKLLIQDVIKWRMHQ
ncbi:hypothetical protein RJ640_024080 [Escallonia rubra]|uniref:Glycosyltransferase n=1 Tax=Escallonia rubra TaxID=112253 RepID=A0AA88RAM5_9ASTE|nr:hypothetical protein RJ640_024080 [Escallonia rubra]